MGPFMPFEILPAHPVPELRDLADKVVRDAFEAGYKHAYGEIREHLAKADLTTILLSQIQSAPTDFGTAAASPSAKVAGNGAVPPPSYGLLKATVRSVMIAAPKNGLLISQVHKRANDAGVVMTQAQVREALRRLQESGHVRCKGRRWWMATDKLRGEAANENEAPEGALDAGKGVASPA